MHGSARPGTAWASRSPRHGDVCRTTRSRPSGPERRKVEGNEGPGVEWLTIDVAPEEQFLWFQIEELDAMPLDLPTPEPSQQELERVAQIRERFGREVLDTMRRRDNQGVEGLAARFGDRAMAVRGVNSVVRRLGRI